MSRLLTHRNCEMINVCPQATDCDYLFLSLENLHDGQRLSCLCIPERTYVHGLHHSKAKRSISLMVRLGGGQDGNSRVIKV